MYLNSVVQEVERYSNWKVLVSVSGSSRESVEESTNVNVGMSLSGR